MVGYLWRGPGLQPVAGSPLSGLTHTDHLTWAVKAVDMARKKASEGDETALVLAELLRETTRAVDLTEPLLELVKGVRKAFDLEPDLQSTENDRDRYAAALIVVGNFITKIVGENYGNRFFELGSAIADLNTGALHPLLALPKQTGRPSPSQIWRGRANAALALHARASCKIKPSDAAKEIVREFPKVANLASARTRRSVHAGSMEKIILEWRKRFSAGRIGNDEALELFEVGLKLINSLKGNVPELQKFARGRGRAAERNGVIGGRSFTH